MKKIIFTAVFSLMICMVFGQSFPGDNPELLLNKEVKPKEKVNQSSQERGYANFFLEYKSFMRQFLNSPDNKPFFVGSERFPRSEYAKLVGKKFKVLEVFEIGGNEFGLKLENSEIGIIYYKYDPTSYLSFELDVLGKLDFPDDYFCSEIEIVKDKFTGEEKHYTPIRRGLNFVKVVKKGGATIYFLSSTTGSTSAIVGGKGFHVLFEDGSKFTKLDARIDVEVYDAERYIYDAFVELSMKDLKMFSEKLITDTRMYIFDDEIDKETALLIREYAKCLLK